MTNAKLRAELAEYLAMVAKHRNPGMNRALVRTYCRSYRKALQLNGFKLP